MLPPPAATYESAIELFQSAQTFANSQGTTVTSRVEGAHATIKTYLCTLAGDLHDVRIKLSLA
ncbi:11853_t:CDS:2, partial [Cetraspora pellucida]